MASPFEASSPLARRTVLAASGAGILGLLATACGGSSAGSGKPAVIVGCYGVQYVAALVAGSTAEVVNLAKPGQEPHDIEISVAESAKIQDADLIVQIPGFQTALDDLIESKGLHDKVLDISTVVDLLPSSGEHEHEHEASDGGGDEHEHGAFDPHFWNDPTMLADVATAIGERLGAADEANASAYTDNAKSAAKTLTELDAELEKAYSAISGDRIFVTSHTAFAYLAARYGLEQVGITGIDPEIEPSPQRLLELQELISQRQVSTIFFEESASPKVAETLAKNVGVKSESLDNLETQLDPEKDYVAVMREDAEKLVASWS